LGLALARAGQCEAAVEIYSRHHGLRFGASIPESLRVMLLDALIIYYCRHDAGAAAGKVERALALAVGFGAKEEVDLLRAWLAHVLFNSCRYDDMLAVLDGLSNADHSLSADTATRVALTLGDALSLGGRFDIASEWYQYARSGAERTGDNLSLAALMHNRASMSLSHCRFDSACGVNLASDAETFLPELGSAKAYETYYRATGGLYPYGIWTSRLDMLRKEFSSALRTIEMMLIDRSISSDDPIFPSVLMDRAYCEFQVGLSDRFEAHASEALALDLTDLHADDRAVLHSNCVEIFTALGKTDMADDHLSRKQVEVRAFADEVRTVREMAEQAVGRLEPAFRQ
jgi:hypothetical protein